MHKYIKILITLLITSLSVLSACNNNTNEIASLRESLANATYPVELTSSGKAKLSDGYFEEQAAPGSVSKVAITLLPQHAKGDLNNDGKEDAAVILVGTGGGTGTFYYVSAVLNKKDGITAMNSKFLGDRIKINSVQIDSGKIVVSFLERSEGEPMSATPSLNKVNMFKLKNDSLSQIGE